MTLKKEFSISKLTIDYDNFVEDDDIIIFERISRLFLTRIGTDFEDKDFGTNLFSYINEFITDMVAKEIITECFRVTALYLPDLTSKIDYKLIRKNKNEFNIQIINTSSKVYVEIDSNSFV